MSRRELSTRQQQVGLAQVLAAVAVVGGSLGVWVEQGITDVSGWDANGGLTLVLGIVAALATASTYWRGYAHRIIAGISIMLFAIIMSVGIYDWVNAADYVTTLKSSFDSSEDAQPGWGLYAVVIGAAAGLLVSMYQVIRPRA